MVATTDLFEIPQERQEVQGVVLRIEYVRGYNRRRVMIIRDERERFEVCLTVPRALLRKVAQLPGRRISVRAFLRESLAPMPEDQGLPMFFGSRPTRVFLLPDSPAGTVS